MPVAARFHALRDRVVAAVDQKFAEPIRLSPMLGGRTDPGRPKVEIEAILRVGEGKESRVDGGRGSGWRSRLDAGKAELHIDRSRYPGLIAKYGDKVRAMARPGEPTFEVKAIDDRSHSRLVLELSEA